MNKPIVKFILLSFLITLSFSNNIINKNYVVKNKYISNFLLKKYYPEIFNYNGKICYSIKDVYIYKPKDKILNFKNEIEKLKLLNILHNTTYKYKVNTELNMKTIQAVGIICGKTLHLRNKDYNITDNLFSNYYIKLIDSNSSDIILYIK